MTAISDALLVTANLSGAASNIMTPYDQLLSFIGELISAQTVCALSGIFLRGGICVGKFYHERDILLSPALVHAHRLETKVAVYPIIVIEKKLVDELQALGGIERYAPGYAPSLAYFREFESPAQPSEKLFHLDYGRNIAEENFGFFTTEDRKAYFDDSRPPKERDRIFNDSHNKSNVAALQQHRDHIMREFAATSDQKVKAKYRWLANYHNDCLSGRLPIFQEAVCHLPD